MRKKGRRGEMEAGENSRKRRHRKRNSQLRGEIASSILGITSTHKFSKHICEEVRLWPPWTTVSSGILSLSSSPLGKVTAPAEAAAPCK
jgi:hypothetical protein